MSSSSPKRLADRIEELPSEGRYTISLEEIQRELDGPLERHRSSLRRLKAKGRLVSPRRGFFVIVPPEYTRTGSPPASWFVDDLMSYLGRPYYVGLLSAAAVHGAAHQHPQVFQVMTTLPTAPMTAGRVRLQFHRKRRLEGSAVVRRNTETGTMAVSTPETTVFDLVRHVGDCGHLDNVATVISELTEVLDPGLLAAAGRLARVTEVQRAGYLLELVGSAGLAQTLEEVLAERRSPLTRLRPDRSTAGAVKSDRWNLMVNERVEPDV